MAAMFGDATDWSACTAARGRRRRRARELRLRHGRRRADGRGRRRRLGRATRPAAGGDRDLGRRQAPAGADAQGRPLPAWGEDGAATAPAGAPATATPDAGRRAPAPAATTTSFWGASEEPEEPLAEPVTFEQATGAARFEAARRCRAAEVTESERQFMREFTAMMAAGLVVVLRVDGSDGVAVTLSLQEFRNEPILEWHFTETGNGAASR